MALNCCGLVDRPLSAETAKAYTRAMARKSSSDTTADAAPPASPVADFEQSLDALEHLVEKMEQGQMSLEDSLAAYERGVNLYRRCQQALEQAELRVRLLSDPEHPDSAEPFSDTANGNG
jgi:exodeoxyribonuclease VII small subunit